MKLMFLPIRNAFQNCFTNVMYRIRTDQRNMKYDMGDIHLDRLGSQSKVECRNWPYEYPQFIKDYIARNPT